MMCSDVQRGWVLCVLGFVLGTCLTSGAARAAQLIEQTAEWNFPSPSGKAVAASPDGTTVYVAAQMGSAPDRLIVYMRDEVAGRLDELQTLENGSGGITAMSDPEFVAVSPDGETVAAASTAMSSVIVFDRDPATGILTFVEELVDGVGGIDGISGVVEIAFSPDSNFLYVPGPAEGTIAVFARDAATSALTPVEVETGGAASPVSARSLSISPDGLHLYTTRAWFTRDLVTGALTLLDWLPGSLSVPVRVSPDGAFVYHILGRYLLRYVRDPATGLLSDPTSTEWSFHSTTHTVWAGWIHPSGEHLYVSYERPGIPDPWNTKRYLALVPIDPATGYTTGFAETIDLAPFEPSPGYIALSTDGGALFQAGISVLNVTESALAADGSASPRAAGFSGPIPSSYRAKMAWSADERFVYTTSSGTIGWVTVWERDLVTGDLTYVDGEMAADGQFQGTKNPRDLALSPDGAHLYVAALGDDSVGWANRDQTSGHIDFVAKVQDGVDGVDGLAGATSVAVSPDGLHVYATGSVDNAVAAFERDPATGALTFIEAKRDGEDGVVGLLGAEAVRISADGQHVYVAGRAASAVAVFSRDVGTGGLSFVESNADGDGGIAGLDEPTHIELSPDGGSVYVYSGGRAVSPPPPEPPALVEFSRDPSTGSLAFRAAHIDELGGVYGVRSTLALSGDGRHLYSGSAVFRRDPSTGSLSFIEEVDRVLGTSSPDGRHVYEFEGRLAKWEHGFSGCAPAPLVGCGQAGKTNLVLRDPGLAAKRKLTWTFVNGTPTTLGQFDPTPDRHYGFCLYDESDVAPELVFAALLPAHGDCRRNYAGLEKPCWSTTSKIKYADPFRTPDGITSALLQPSVLPKTRIKLKGKGAALPLHDLPLGLPLRAQLQTVDGSCWEATYGIAKKNDETTFKAKTP